MSSSLWLLLLMAWGGLWLWGRGLTKQTYEWQKAFTEQGGKRTVTGRFWYGSIQERQFTKEARPFNELPDSAKWNLPSSSPKLNSHWDFFFDLWCSILPWCHMMSPCTAATPYSTNIISFSFLWVLLLLLLCFSHCCAYTKRGQKTKKCWPVKTSFKKRMTWQCKALSFQWWGGFLAKQGTFSRTTRSSRRKTGKSSDREAPTRMYYGTPPRIPQANQETLPSYCGEAYCSHALGSPHVHDTFVHILGDLLSYPPKCRETVQQQILKIDTSCARFVDLIAGPCPWPPKFGPWKLVTLQFIRKPLPLNPGFVDEKSVAVVNCHQSFLSKGWFWNTCSHRFPAGQQTWAKQGLNISRKPPSLFSGILAGKYFALIFTSLISRSSCPLYKIQEEKEEGFTKGFNGDHFWRHENVFHCSKSVEHSSCGATWSFSGASKHQS